MYVGRDRSDSYGQLTAVNVLTVPVLTSKTACLVA